MRAATGTGRAWGSHAERVSVLVKARSAPAAAAAHEDGGHVAGLVVGQALCVDLDLAGHGHNRHEHAGGLQRGEGGGQARGVGRVGGVRRECRGQRRVGLAGVVGVGRGEQLTVGHAPILPPRTTGSSGSGGGTVGGLTLIVECLS